MRSNPGGNLSDAGHADHYDLGVVWRKRHKGSNAMIDKQISTSLVILSLASKDRN